MHILKSTGVTQTEKLLAKLCEQSFLKLWSYPNPVKDDGHEFCDLLAVFDNHVFIFFDRKIVLDEVTGKDPQVLWGRWKSKVIDDQIRTARGAERYLRTGRALFLDGKKTVLFPLNINIDTMIVHKIVVAHGAKEACERFADANVYGSLGISYANGIHDMPSPFMISLDNSDPVHIFDSHNLPIIFAELDTFFDFSRFLDAKIKAISEFKFLSYCGEEDLLAHYFLNYDDVEKRYFIGSKDKSFDSVLIGEGEWKDFIDLAVYKNKKNADQVSYFWDALIQKTCKNALDGTLMGDADLLRGRSAIHEMAKEPRFMRRALSQKMLDSVSGFPKPKDKIMMRNVNLMPSFFPNKAYVFLQILATEEVRQRPQYREIRQQMLEIACGAAKNMKDELTTIVGIAVDAPKFHKEIAEDFLLIDCSNWTPEKRHEYAELNKELGFFASPSMKQYKERVTDFIPSDGIRQQPATSNKISRNALCPCNSGRKYKKCCMK